MSSELLRVRVDALDASCLVTCTGELDVFTRDQFDDTVGPLVRAGGVLVLDMRGVTFVDSSGLLSILLLRRAFEGRRGELVVRPSAAIRDLFRVTGIPMDDRDPPTARPHAEGGASYPAAHWDAVVERAYDRLAAAEGGNGFSYPDA